ncbi:MAG: hypothetical protein O2973_13045 [Gemmatimonadetes bacterium]|nr:hypothetical protein [Gemmatimonadota bacterium]
MSRAFVKEDSGGYADRAKRYATLPPRDDPEYDAAAAHALLEAARAGETGAAEEATGYYWGEPRLHAHVRAMLEQARAEGDDRLEQLAERFLK